MNKRNIVRGIVAAAVVLTVVWLWRAADPREITRGLLAWIEALGPWAPFWFVAAYVLSCLTFFPGILLTAGGAILFGVPKAVLLVSIGATIGAACGFLISRYAARGWVQRKWGANPRFAAIDAATEREGWKIVGLMRLSPVVPFVPMNFLFGLTRVPLLHFVLATWAGILPLTFVYALLGSVIGDLAELGKQPVSSGPWKWIITAAGLASTVVVTLLVTRVAKRALAGKVPEMAKAAGSSEPAARG